MKCIICHGDQIEPKRVNEEYYDGNDIVYVPVDVLVCKSCGERYYDRKTKQYLEQAVDGIRKNALRFTEIGKVKVLAA